MHLSNLEEQLAGPERETVLAALIGRLEGIEQRLGFALRQGLEPEIFRQWQACHQAVRGAAEELRRLNGRT